LEAVEIARAANEGLDIIGKVNNVDQSYWQKTLPYVDGNRISYLGPKPQAEVARHLAKAKAFIFPSQSREAFGQVTVEAQACGTPVIISDIGASKELVEDGKSGFVVGSQEEFIGAVKNISRIDRRYCRKFAENFDINKMVEEYNNLYEKLVGL
ncbi:MAG TPA: glycosyltransferase, partial [Candidatus Saccharimonadales bacterium]|nr:glycosyltransferase [Candidatus Saccharimonadales bacterium]